MLPLYFGKIMNVFSMHTLAIAGIEILVGLTMIGTLLAIIGLFLGVIREKKSTETEAENTDDDDQDVEVLESEITSTTEKSHETKGSPEELKKNAEEPVMAILQKTESRNEPVGGEELERQIVEKRLQRIADKRAEHKKDEPGELPAFPIPPKVAGEKSALPPLPKPFLHELPQPGGEKPAKYAHPKQGGDLPPMPGSASAQQDDADLQPRDEEHDS